MSELPKGFYHVHLRLAREAGHPEGDSEHGYDLVAPLTPDGGLDAELWRSHKADCRVRRFRPGEEDAIGHLARHPGGRWYLDYAEGDEDDEAGFRFNEERFTAGEYVSIRDEDGEMHTYRIVTVEPLA